MSQADPSTEPDHIKQLRAKAAESDSNAQENRLLKIEMAFIRAGVDTSSKPGQAMISGYEGELTPDAVLAEAATWNLAPTAEPPADPPTPPATQETTPPTEQPDPATQAAHAQQQQDQVRDALTGAGGPATPPEAPTVNGLERAMHNYGEQRKRGVPRQDALGLAVNDVMAAAIADGGDPSVRFDQEAWEKKQAEAGHGAKNA